jgi:tricarballylate dehydrogenase
MFMPPVYPPYAADTVEELACLIRVSPESLARTVADFNAAVSRDTPLDRSRLDGRGTDGLRPPKSNWATPIERSPFYAYPLRPGVTFTYLAVAVDRHARVLGRDGAPWVNVFAAGEIMAGNILREGYLAGFGLTIGSVFGRIAGEEAASYAGAA